MRKKIEVEQKLLEVEKKVRDYRNKKDFCDEHWRLTEQMATLRWVLAYGRIDRGWDIEDLRDT